MGKQRYSDSFKEAVVQKVRDGQSVAQVSRDSGVTQTSVAKWVKQFDVKNAGREITSGELAEIKPFENALANSNASKKF